MFLKLFVAIAVLGFSIQAVTAVDLKALYEALAKKQDTIKQQQLASFITKFVPYGIPVPNPKIAEYETFKSDKSANFLNDGTGKIYFREFRRVRLSDILGHHIHAGI